MLLLMLLVVVAHVVHGLWVVHLKRRLAWREILVDAASQLRREAVHSQSGSGRRMCPVVH